MSPFVPRDDIATTTTKTKRRRSKIMKKTIIGRILGVLCLLDLSSTSALTDVSVQPWCCDSLTFTIN
jgi:hypothetical protein